MELFEGASKAEMESGLDGPLAHRMRPKTLEEFAGQHHIVGAGRLLRRVIQADQLTSLIFYGPPGTGKTTLARIIANSTKSHFITMNAVLSGVKELRKAIAEAQEHRNLYTRRTLLFIDEVHRWNKAQQDALLPWVENGTVILIGATTQNPFFEVNSALVSRSRIFQLTPLNDTDLTRIAHAAISDPVRGYGQYSVSIDDDALEHLVSVANGDARSLLNALELAVETTPDSFPPEPDEVIQVTREIAEESIQKKVVLYDKEGDYHFDTISAFIKSIRGSDPDAALYWMARMIYAGEDPRYVFRRMLISAAEDIGLADPAALSVVESAAAAFDRVGMPEGQFFLSQAALYLATTEKSNSTLGYFDAVAAVEEEQARDVPNHLRDASRDAKGFGHGEGYLYPHAYRDHWVAQNYLPKTLQGTKFYTPGSLGYEGERRVSILRKREAQLAASEIESRDEVLSFTPTDKGKDRWLARLADQRSETLGSIRDAVFELAGIARHHTILDLNADHGLLLWEALRSVPEGGVTGVLHGSAIRVRETAKSLAEHEQPFLVMVEELGIDTPSSRATDRQTDHSANDRIENLPEEYDRIIGLNAITASGIEGFLNVCHRRIAVDGLLVLCEAIPRNGQLLSDLKPVRENCSKALVDEFRNAEIDLRESGLLPMFALSETSLERLLLEAGFEIRHFAMKEYLDRRVLREEQLKTWLDSSGSEEQAPGAYAKGLANRIGDENLAEIRHTVMTTTAGEPLDWLRCYAVVVAKSDPSARYKL